MIDKLNSFPSSGSDFPEKKSGKILKGVKNLVQEEISSNKMINTMHLSTDGKR